MTNYTIEEIEQAIKNSEYAWFHDEEVKPNIVDYGFGEQEMEILIDTAKQWVELQRNKL